MEKKQKRMMSMDRMNKSTIGTYSTMVFLLLAAYLLEYFKGARTLGYTIVFSILDLVPYILCVVSYKKEKTANNIKYIVCVGFSVLYAFVLLTAAVPTTFVYIFLIFLIAIPYGDMILCYIIGGIAVLANLVSIVWGFSSGSLDKGDLAMVEIQIISVVLAAIFTGVATKVIEKIGEQRIDVINEEKAKVDALLKNILEVSQGISADIALVSEQMEQLDRSVSTTKESMQDVASGATETAEIMQEQLLQTESIVEQVEKAKNVSHTIADDVKVAEECITIGKQNVETLLACVSQSEEVSGVVEAKMQELYENTEQMHSIVEIINSVTNQTSMLSLNASIEAARAGEAGRGFAVVAQEIATLAKQTSDATVNITDLIRKITGSIDEVVKSINKMVESNKEQNHSAETMAENFQSIESSAARISDVSASLEDVIRVLAELNNAIVGNIDTVSGVTEEMSAKASQTYSESESNAVVVEEIAKVMVEINDKAQKLNISEVEA